MWTQKSISCVDAIFATQEVLLNLVRQGSNPYLCFYDIEKAFDSIANSTATHVRCWNKWKMLESHQELVLPVHCSHQE